MKNLLLVCLLLIISCNFKKGNNDQTSASAAHSKIEKPVNTKQGTPYIIVTVSDKAQERIDETEDFSPAELRTTRLKENEMITTFNAFLGAFDDAHDYGLDLTFIRTSDEHPLQEGTFPLVAFGDRSEIQSDLLFESMNTINSITYNNMKASGTTENYPDKFYAPLDENNIVVITSAGNPVETEDSNAYNSEHFQPVKGHLIFNVIKVMTGEPYKIRVDFSLIHEIRIPQKH